MRERVQLERPSFADDGLGGAEISWIAAGDVWAAIATRGAGEGPAHDGARTWTNYAVTVDRVSDVRVGWRMIWGVRCLRITGVLDDGSRRIELRCEEERP